MSFTDSVLESKCIIHPLTHGLGRNTGTTVPPDIVLENPISKEVTRDTRLEMLALIVAHACAT